ncbi:MAG: YqeG family HAD IIIA-type phosphatase [Ruminococcus sp.]|nr:YqeG family HAD IIIA-type phosphatase [Ruminococcus sp.]
MLSKFYPYEYAKSVFEIDYKKLYDKGFRGIIFDIDNTLVHHGDDSTEAVDQLFVDIHNAGFKTLLLSNNEKSRVERFIRNIDTDYICDADKPDPACYLKAVEKMGLDKDQVVCIGDQIFTDIYGANRAGLASILVKYIRVKEETMVGKRRLAEYLMLETWKRNKKQFNRIGDIYPDGTDPESIVTRDFLFCEISPGAYAISEAKEKSKRYVKELTSKDVIARTKCRHRYPVIVATESNGLIKVGKDIDPQLQENKAVNIDLACKKINGIVIHPGEVFSFWKSIGKITKKKGYKEGRVISGEITEPGLGGGLCNLGNTIHRLVLHSPLQVWEFHSHSDALSPDHGKRVPFSAGTCVCYNYIDYRFKNTTDQDFQLLAWVKDKTLFAELRCVKALPYTYELSEEGHHFQQEDDGKFYRVSKIYKNTLDKESGELLKKELVLDNHSEVMYDYDMIPKELIEV